MDQVCFASWGASSYDNDNFDDERMHLNKNGVRFFKIKVNNWLDETIILIRVCMVISMMSSMLLAGPLLDSLSSSLFSV